VLVGGEYGSEGKGHIASYLAREYSFLLRVGGPNAGHTVYERPKPYTFHHLPSGTRSSEAKLILGPGAVISVPVLQKEISECHVTRERLFIDPHAMIIDPDDVAFENRTLAKSIGSTAQGVGAATARKILRNAAGVHVQLAGACNELKPYVRETRAVLDGAFASGERVFLEGTQGTALSLHHGFYPHVTSRDTTVSGCLAEAGIAPSRVRRIVLTCRTYPIRVQNPRGGTSGRIGRELSWKEISERSGIPLPDLRQTEKTSTTGRKRRVAEFDWALLRMAASLNGPTDIALTFADYLSVKNRQARRFEQLQPETIRFIQEVERVSGAPVSLISTRFHFRSIIDRRSW
jgi:adenylosuccinate synthase